MIPNLATLPGYNKPHLAAARRQCLSQTAGLIYLRPRMKCFITLIALVAFSMVANSETTNTILLWQGAPPGALGKADKDIPTLTPYFPDPAKATGAAMVVCPGGGYGGLADHEGKDYALWLKDQGIMAFVLKYRLGSAGYRHPIELGDAARALRL